MDIKEMFSRMQSGEVKAHSEMGTRDESKQMRTFASRIQKMRTVTGIKAHALVMKDVVIPFNPFTCETDTDYNAKNTFRPILLVSQVLTGLKSLCAENPELAKKWEKKLDIGEGVIDWAAPLTMQDYFCFKKAGYIKPRVMSYSTVAMSFGGVGGFSEYTQRYTVDPTELNEQGTYDYDNAPIWHKAAIFFNSMLRPEAEAMQKSMEKNAASKEQISTARQAIFSKAPVRFVSPMNLLPFLYVPIDEAPKEFKPQVFSEFEGYVRYYGYNQDKWSTAFDEASKNDQYDENMDFYDFTIRTPTSKQTKSDGKVFTDNDGLDLYKAMTITNTDARASIWNGKSSINGTMVENSQLYAFLFEAAAAYFEHSQEESSKEGGETFEKLMAASNRCRPITSVMDKFLPACNQKFLSDFAESQYFTDEVKKANAEFFTAMNPDNAMALAEVDEEDLEAASEGQKASVAKLIEEATEGSEDPVEELRLSDEDEDDKKQ